MLFLRKEEMVTLSAAVIKFQHKICSRSQSPTATNCGSQDLNIVSLAPEFMLLTSLPLKNTCFKKYNEVVRFCLCAKIGLFYHQRIT